MNYCLSMQWVAPIAINIRRNSPAGHTGIVHQRPDSTNWRHPMPKETTRAIFQMGFNSCSILMFYLLASGLGNYTP